MSNKNNNTIKKPAPISKLAQEQIVKKQLKESQALSRNLSLPIMTPQLDEDQSEFLDLNQEMHQKLQNIDRKKEQKRQPKRRDKISKQKILNKSLDHKEYQTVKKHIQSSEQKRSEMKVSQKQIKKQFVQKMKEWSKQKEELEHKKQVLENHKKKLKQQKEEKKNKQKQEEEEFFKLQKKKQLEKKINQIEERRKRREDSLKNAVLKRSYNGVPKYLEYEQKFEVKEKEDALLDLKLMKSKKEKMKMDPEELKKHEKAYIQRIKQRLNMKSNKKQSRHRQTNSDFNLYLKRSEELKKEQLNKIIRRKKFQQKLSKMDIKIDQAKKQQKLISIDKAKNPQKYHILERKALNDRQIYQQFKGVQIELDGKKKGNDYLNKLKQSPKKQQKKNYVERSLVKSHELERNTSPPPPKLPKIQNKKIKVSPMASKSQKTISVRKASSVRTFSQLSEGQTYSRNLLKSKERDSKYMNALRDKLAFLDD